MELYQKMFHVQFFSVFSFYLINRSFIYRCTLKFLALIVFTFSKTLLVGQVENEPHKKLRITPLPVIFYSPETKLGYGALVAVNFKTSPDTITKLSFVRTNFIYTVNRQYSWVTNLRTYSPSNKFIMQGTLLLSYFPEFYYGIETEQPKPNEVLISYNRIMTDIRLYWKIKTSTYLGLSTRYNNIYDVASDQNGSLYEDKPTGYKGYQVFGLAPLLCIESRDNQVYPSKGTFMELQLITYPNILGSPFSFFNARLDARKYFPLHWLSARDVLAFQAVLNLNTGDVPFKDMADIGDGNMMRGYYGSYYRYKNLYACQVEYRAGLWKFIGFSLWVGGALTPKQWYSLGDTGIKPNAGIGLRLMLNRADKLNVRLDQGFGNQNQQGFYMNIAEAF